MIPTPEDIRAEARRRPVRPYGYAKVFEGGATFVREPALAILAECRRAIEKSLSFGFGYDAEAARELLSRLPLAAEARECPTCKGTGTAILVGGGAIRPQPCPTCKRTGRIPAPAEPQPKEDERDCILDDDGHCGDEGCDICFPKPQPQAAPTPEADVELRDALEELVHAVCGETGFANAVRKVSGLAYPWPALDIAEARAQAALARPSSPQAAPMPEADVERVAEALAKAPIPVVYFGLWNDPDHFTRETARWRYRATARAAIAALAHPSSDDGRDPATVERCAQVAEGRWKVWAINECGADACEDIATAIRYLLPARPSSPPGVLDPATPAARDVLAERRRQTEVEGWTPEHDDAHRNGELARAAAAYARHAGSDEDTRQVNLDRIEKLEPRETPALDPATVEQCAQVIEEQRKRRIQSRNDAGFAWDDATNAALVGARCNVLTLLTARTTEQPKRWRHVKRGATYTEIGRGKLAAMVKPYSGQRLVIYCEESDGQLWARPEYEFGDGRFVPAEQGEQT